MIENEDKKEGENKKEEKSKEEKNNKTKQENNTKEKEIDTNSAQNTTTENTGLKIDIK